MYVKTTMRMLTILREVEVWMRVHLREACFRECIYEKLSLRTSKRQSACTSNNFTFSRPLMGTIFLVMNILQDTTDCSGRHKLTSAMKLRSKKQW